MGCGNVREWDAGRVRITPGGGGGNGAVGAVVPHPNKTKRHRILPINFWSDVLGYIRDSPLGFGIDKDQLGNIDISSNCTLILACRSMILAVIAAWTTLTDATPLLNSCCPYHQIPISMAIAMAI